MKKLHLIGFTPDDDGLLLTARKGSKSGGFVVPVDEALLAAVEQARRRRDGEEPEQAGADRAARSARVRAHSSLSPREIQSRLRAGSTIAEVASQAGVDDEWVLRFAAPILAEQAQVVESAQRLTLVKARRGPSIEPLAPSVQWNLSDRGVNFSDDVFADCWTAFNLHGARWAVRFAYTSRKRRQVAEWEVDLRERSLVSRNRLATDLGHVEEGRRRPSVEPADPGALDTVLAPAPGRPGARGRSQGAAGPAANAGPKGRARSGPGSAPAGVAGRRAAAKKAGSAGTRTIAGGAPGPPAKKAKAPAARSSASGATAKRAGAAMARGEAPGLPRVSAKKAAGRSPATKAAGKATRGRAASGAPSQEGATAGPASRSSRESSPRKASAKKATGDSPGPPGPARRGSPVPEIFPERPSHLARPPSPMKMTNRATSHPQRLTATHARPGLSPAQPGRPAAGGPAFGAQVPEPARDGNPRFDPAPAPQRQTKPSGPARSAARATATKGAKADSPTPPRATGGNGAGASSPSPPAPSVRSGPSAGASPEGDAGRPAFPAAQARRAPAGPAVSVLRPDAPASPPPEEQRAARVAVAPPIGRRPTASGAEVAGDDDEGPAVVILAPRAAGGPVSTPEERERQARLASAERLRSALTGESAPQAPPGAGAVRPRREARTPSTDRTPVPSK